MYYTGKHIDTFAPAMQTLFQRNGYGVVPHLDAMGKRCFGFYNGITGTDYYMPVINTEEAVRSIAEHMGLEDKLIVYRSMCAALLKECPGAGMIYGPIVGELVLRRPRDLYYHGGNRYIFIQREQRGTYHVTDPDGFPGLCFTEEELESVFHAERGVGIVLQPKVAEAIKALDVARIWRDGVAFLRETAWRMSCFTQRQEAFVCYQDTASLRIALWYGVINFVQQIERVWILRDEVLGHRRDDRRFRILQSAMIHAAEQGNVSTLPELEASVWKEIEYEV